MSFLIQLYLFEYYRGTRTCLIVLLMCEVAAEQLETCGPGHPCLHPALWDSRSAIARQMAQIYRRINCSPAIHLSPRVRTQITCTSRGARHSALNGDDEPATETIFNDEFAAGPAMRALVAAFTTAYDQDRKRRHTD